jgi:hypothetical protein
MSPQLEELWLYHALTTFAKQMHLANVLGRHEWLWEARTGLLRLRSEGAPSETRFATQVLGSESQMSETWTWIWADNQANLNENLMRAARQLRDFGEKNNIPELCEGEFPLKQANGHILSLIACDVVGADAYYSAPFLGGTGFLLIDDEAFPLSSPLNAARVGEIVRAGVKSLPLRDEKRAVENFFLRMGWQVEDDGAEFFAHDAGGAIRARFDEARRLLQIEDAAPPKTSEN